MAILIFANAATGRAATLSVIELDKNGNPLDQAVVFLLSHNPTAVSGHAPLEATVSQHNMQFTPYVTVVGLGAKVTFPNLDGVLHHVKSFSTAKPFEFKISTETPPPIIMDQTGVVALNCLIHDWMRGYILVIDTPWYGIADTSGTVKILNIPVGAYTAYAWHPDLGTFLPPLTQEVSVAADGSVATFNFPFSPRPQKKMHPM